MNFDAEKLSKVDVKLMFDRSSHQMYFYDCKSLLINLLVALICCDFGHFINNLVSKSRRGHLLGTIRYVLCKYYIRGLVKILPLLQGARRSLFSEVDIHFVAAPASCRSYCILYTVKPIPDCSFPQRSDAQSQSIKFCCLLYPKINVQVINLQNKLIFYSNYIC